MPESAKPQLVLENFNGPLDLLLNLIEQQRLDITAVSLAQVAEQYLAAVATLSEPDPDALAEFLVIGAKLLVIKTRALLPRPPAELAPSDEEDVGAQLARQLHEYRRFKSAAAQLRAWEQAGLHAYSRSATPPVPPPRLPPRLDLHLADLVAAMQRRMQLLLPLEDDRVPLPTPKLITIADVRQRVHDILRQREWTSFDDLLSLAVTRNEVIVTLWTVLELFKREIIVIEQDRLFGAIGLGRGDRFDPNAELLLNDEA